MIPPLKYDMERPWIRAQNWNANFFDVFCMHSMKELYAISEILKSHVPERIVEYGTAYGGLTRLLGRWAYLYDCEVLTIENGGYTSQDGHEKDFKLFDILPVKFLRKSEYLQETYDEVQEFSRDKRTLFYCDGGNKPLEFRSISRILKPHDLLVTHDYDMDDSPGSFLLKSDLNPIVISVAHVKKEFAEKCIKENDLEVVFEELLGGGKRKDERITRLLAVRKKISPSEINENNERK